MFHEFHSNEDIGVKDKNQKEHDCTKSKLKQQKTRKPRSEPQREPGVSELLAGRESQHVAPAISTDRPPFSSTLELQDRVPATQTH